METKSAEPARLHDRLPPDSKDKMKQTLADLKQKLPEKFKTPEFDDFIEVFAIAYETNYELFQNGGKVEADGKEITLAPCDLDDHNWHHIHTDLETVAHILPGFLKKHSQYELNDIKNLFLATLLHDNGWLVIKPSVYAWGGEKYFIHCQDSITLAAPILQLINKFDLNSQDISSIRDSIRLTEFNPLLSETFTHDELAQVLLWADRLSYFADPKDIPVRVQNLFKETQASANPKCQRTYLYFYENLAGIAKGLGIEPNVAEDLFLNGRLSIADIKFPSASRHAGLFVGNGYLPFMLPELTPALNYIDEWYEGQINEDRKTYYINIARAETVRELNQEAHMDGLCYFEGSFEIEDLLSVCDKYHLDLKNINWQELKLKTLGVGKYKHDLFARLSTQTLKEMFATATPEERVNVLADLFQKVAEKGNPKDTLRVAIALFTYRQILDYQEIIPASAIIDAVARCNATPGEKSQIEPIWTVRREVDFTMVHDNQTQYLGMIKGSGIKKVIFAGREENELADYKDFLEKLTEARIEIIIQAGQVLDEDLHAQLAEKNVAFALEFAATHEKVQLLLMGNHIPSDKTDLVAQLAAQKRIIMSPSTDIEAGIVRDFESHPASSLAKAGIYAAMASCNQQFPSTMVLEAIGVACAKDPPEFADASLTDYDKFVGRYKDYYLAETRKFLFSPN